MHIHLTTYTVFSIYAFTTLINIYPFHRILTSSFPFNTLQSHYNHTFIHTWKERILKTPTHTESVCCLYEVNNGYVCVRVYCTSCVCYRQIVCVFITRPHFLQNKREQKLFDFDLKNWKTEKYSKINTMVVGKIS